MGKTQVVIGLISPLPLDQREDGIAILKLWRDFLPSLLPEKYGKYEPINEPFDANNIERIADEWDWPFLAKNKATRMQSGVWQKKSDRIEYSTWNLSANANAVSQGELLQFLALASTVLQADFACLNLLTQREIERGRGNGTVMNLNRTPTKFAFSLNGLKLSAGLPDVYWCTVFGERFVKQIGIKRLLEAPVFKATLINEEGVMLQLTEKLSDVETSEETIDLVRRRTKAKLGSDAFQNFVPIRLGGSF